MSLLRSAPGQAASPGATAVETGPGRARRTGGPGCGAGSDSWTAPWPRRSGRHAGRALYPGCRSGRPSVVGERPTGHERHPAGHGGRRQPAATAAFRAGSWRENRIGGHPAAALATVGRPVPRLSATVPFPRTGLLGVGLLGVGPAWGRLGPGLPREVRTEHLARLLDRLRHERGLGAGPRSQGGGVQPVRSPDRSRAGGGRRPRASPRPVAGTRLRAPHRNEAGQQSMRQPRECLSSGRRL